MKAGFFPQTEQWLRFVVLEHFGQKGIGDHYDVVLDILGMFGTDDSDELALDKMETSDALDGTVLKMSDSMIIRRRYLDYEGAMRGDRGFVRRVDDGRYMLTDSGVLIFDGLLLKGDYEFRDDDETLVMCRLN